MIEGGDKQRQKLAETIAGLQNDDVSLKLSTTDLCFLLALATRAEIESDVDFDEDTLLEVHRQVLEVTHPSAENPGVLGSNTITRFRKQRLIRRIDGDGLMRAGDYSLTLLATGIIDFYFNEEALTRESLISLTRTLIIVLNDVKNGAEKASCTQEWQRDVIAPLNVTFRDLVGGIKRRQRGMDAQQKDVQKQISEVLKPSDWTKGIEACEELLDSTTKTLKELRTLLLRDTDHIRSLLQEILELASQAEEYQVETVVSKMMDRVDRVAAWGDERQKTWTAYYNRVHVFLRQVVRLDPGRALSTRLRNRLTQWENMPYALVYTRAPRITLLRDVHNQIPRPPVERPHQNREPALATVPPDHAADILKAAVEEALETGATTLSEVVKIVLPLVKDKDRYRTIGRVVNLIGSSTQIQNRRERQWVDISEDLEIEEWTLLGREKKQ